MMGVFHHDTQDFTNKPSTERSSSGPTWFMFDLQSINTNKVRHDRY